MIIMTTVFQYKSGAGTGPIPHDDLLAAIEEKLIATGKMLFYHGPMKFVGADIAGQEWDEAVVYGLRDVEALREWMMFPEHAVVDRWLTENGVVTGALGFQMTDEDDPDIKAKIADAFQEATRDRSRWPAGADVSALRLGPEFATEGLED